ncbi:MAG TPA: glycosyltransferase family 2 protein [Candidatus Methylacidiphilales bacterium]|nr:glycosyltransferase family 2 protein [Candidatus Methylacidiphilales bacterium]
MERPSACLAPTPLPARPAGDRLISIVSGCYNEEENVRECYEQVKKVFQEIGRYRYEHIFIDNASKDGTVAILREIAAKDRNVKVILNARNFGHIRSPHHAMVNARGDAVISLVSDLQDPPELIKEFIKKWEEGFLVVIAVKADSDESPVFFAIRKLYYEMVSRLAEIELNKNATGFGLYDRRFVDILAEIDDPYPYFRGLVSEIGFPVAKIPYHQPTRKRGITSNNFYRLYDMAMLGITNHSKVPLRLATMLGFVVSFLSLCVALGYLVFKLLYWDKFQLGLAPLEIGLFFFGSVQLFFIGILGEYIGAIYTQVQRRPHVVELERINFESETMKGFSSP